MSRPTIGKLYGPLYAPENMKALTIAELSGVKLEIITGFEIMTDTKTPEYLAKFPLGQSPSFEGSNEFCLSESAAICIYILQRIT